MPPSSYPPHNYWNLFWKSFELEWCCFLFMPGAVNCYLTVMLPNGMQLSYNFILLIFLDLDRYSGIPILLRLRFCGTTMTKCSEPQTPSRTILSPNLANASILWLSDPGKGEVYGDGPKHRSVSNQPTPCMQEAHRTCAPTPWAVPVPARETSHLKLSVPWHPSSGVLKDVKCYRRLSSSRI
jgi:hypothetical protein